MKTFLYDFIRNGCFICLVCICNNAKGQVNDDFSDGNFTENPAWTGDAAQFEINSSKQLHLRSTASDTSVLVTRNNEVKKTEWSFWLKLSFNTSSNNYARIYLTADTPALFTSVNGYYLQAGGADDSIYIMKQAGSTIAKLFSYKSYKMVHSNTTLRFKIICDEYGNWEAMIDTTGGNNFYSGGTFFDDSFQTTGWFGLYCRYTSSNSTKFYFDDFYVGPVIRDTIPPGILLHEVLTEKTIRLTFSEAIQSPGAEAPNNYIRFSTETHPDSVCLDVNEPTVVTLYFHDSSAVSVYDSLLISNVQDLSGNYMRDTVVQVCFYKPKPYDIVIHEIMADPDPPVELPNGEFIELYNRTSFPINLKDWSLRYGSYLKVFPPIVIQPKGYLLVMKDSVYLSYGFGVFLFTSGTSLSNEGTTLVLKDSRQHVIHSVSYSPDWYKGSFKEEGGWSLEMMDPLNPCGCAENWGASQNATGGTPGKANSISTSNPDLTTPLVPQAVISDSATVDVFFSEPMDSASLLYITNWDIISIETLTDEKLYPVSVVPVSPDFSSAKLVFGEVFKKGTTYLLSVSDNMKDCAGNQMDSSITTRFAIPDTATVHDVVINEILSDPVSGGSRFVELYNRSDNIIDLQSLVLSNSSTLEGLITSATPLMARGYLLFPGDYIAITSSPENICEKYRSPDPEKIVKMSSFPVFGDDTGTMILARRDDLSVIDRFRYDPDMHYPLLVTREGVSLERTHPDMPSDDRNNWHSAAETVGFATPAYSNSHRVIFEASDCEIAIEPEIFSPDNDGYNDLLNIILRIKYPDCVVNITVYDSRGRFVKRLINNVLTGSEEVFTWDGITDNRGKASLGFYIILIEIIKPDGIVNRIKKTAILGGRL